MLSLIGNSLYSQTLSYEEAIILMQENNKKLQGLEMQKTAASYAEKQAIGLRLPTVKLTGKAMHINDDLAINLNEKRNMLSKLLKIPKPQILGDWRYTFQKQQFGSVDLELTYPLFTGGKINAGVAASKIKTQIKNTEVFKEQQALLTELTSRYFQLQLALEVVKVRKEALEAVNQHLYNAKKMEENGMLAGVERLQAETAASEANRELLASEKDAQLAKTALEGLLGVKNIPTVLNTPLSLSTKVKTLDYYQQQAAEHFPQIKKLYLLQQLALEGVKAKRSEYIPNIALIGKKHLYSKNLPLTEPDWYVGVGLSFTLFDGMKRRNELKETQATAESVALFREQASQDIQILVKKHYQELEKQKELSNSLKTDLNFAKELIRVRQKAFAEGFGKSLDVIDANLYLSSIKLKKLKALYDYDITLASLLETCGESIDFSTYIKE